MTENITLWCNRNKLTSDMYKKTTENRKFTQILLKETLIWCYMDTNRLQSTCESNADWRSVSVSNKSRRQESPAVKASPSPLLPPASSHLVVLSRRVFDDLHGGRQRGVSLLVLLLLPAALHPGGRLGEEVTIFTEDSLKQTDTRHRAH